MRPQELDQGVLLRRFSLEQVIAPHGRITRCQMRLCLIRPSVPAIGPPQALQITKDLPQVGIGQARAPR
jgi:hypothetical protein